MQYEKHPETKEKLIDEKQIIMGLAHKSIKQYAYICHDKDVYSIKDETEDKTGNKKMGEKKPRHWHIVLRCDNAVEVSAIAKWFGVPEQYVDVPKGVGAFLDCIQYLTHEDEKQAEQGKHRYEDKDICANFDFRAELDVREERKLRYGKDLSIKERIEYEVRYNGMTLNQAQAKDRINYMHDCEKLKKLRIDYISTLAPPKTRINYYISGRGGVGKGLISRALARNLFPDIEDDSDIFFETGAKGALFEGYDGQPVIIWNDRRAGDLLKELGGRSNVFNVLDTHPTRQKQNIKYSSINLCNKVNIINSVQSYEDFLDGLAGEYTDKNGEVHAAEDKGQSYRRVPFIIKLHEQDFDLLLNRGFYEGTNTFDEYIEYAQLRGNMQKIAERCQGNEPLAREIESQCVKNVVTVHNDVLDRLEKWDEAQEDAIRAEFKGVGLVKRENISYLRKDDMGVEERTKIGKVERH